MKSSQMLWPDFMADLQDPGLIWQGSTLLFCMLAGWGLSHLLMAMFVARGERLGVLKNPLGSFRNVLSPLLSVLLIMLAIPVLGRWQHTGLLRIAAPLFFSFVLIRSGFFLLRRVFARGGRVGSILLAFEKIFALVVWISVALYITGLLPEIVEHLEITTLPIGRHQVSLLMIIQALLSVVLTLMLALWAGAVLEQRLMQLDSVHSSLRVVLARVARASLILVAVLVSLSLVGLDLTVLSVFGGALGVGIGLGLQKLVSNYVSGFVILLERSFSIGDLITIDKFSGRIEEIKTRYTILRGADGAESVIPNEMLISGPVQNLSLTDRNIRLGTSFTIAHDTDIDWLFPKLEQSLTDLIGVLKDPAPAAMLMHIATEGLLVEIGFSIAPIDKDNKSAITSSVNRLILLRLRELNVVIPDHAVK